MTEYGKGFVIPKWLIPIAILGILAVLFGSSISNSFSGTSSTSADSTSPNPAPKDELTQNNVPVVTATPVSGDNKITTTRIEGNYIITSKKVSVDQWVKINSGDFFEIPDFGKAAITVRQYAQGGNNIGLEFIQETSTENSGSVEITVKIKLKTKSGTILTTDPAKIDRHNQNEIMVMYGRPPEIVEWQPEIYLETRKVNQQSATQQTPIKMR